MAKDGVMADDGLTLELSAELSERVKAAAAVAGQTVQTCLETLIAGGLEGDAHQDDWAEDEARWADYERTGISIPADIALAEFRDSLAKRFAARK